MFGCWISGLLCVFEGFYDESCLDLRFDIVFGGSGLCLLIDGCWVFGMG